MANLVSFEQFDLNAINLNWYFVNATSSLLQHGTVSVRGVQYADSYYVRASGGFDSLELDFYGSNFAQDASGRFTSGTVNFIGEFDVRANSVLWFAEGFNTSAVAIYNAATTSSNLDEIQLIQAALAGNDTITLSPFADRISGFAGNDTITGGLGSDMLSGGGGNDLFLDTAAGLNGDTITDFSLGDRIIVSDANPANFSFSLNGSTLSYNGGSLTLGAVPSGHLVARAASGGGVELTFITTAPENDFNGDGRSDILWRNDNGQVGNWLGQANGSFAYNAAGGVTPVSIDWHIAGTGDFNGDGRSDVLWRNDNGQFGDWLGQANGGLVYNAAAGVTSVPNDWHIAGTGDFNGDGRTDILWRNDNGQVGDWLGQTNGGFAYNATAGVTPVSTDWHIAGTGDFNGDGRSDILWRNDNGQVGNWLGQANGSFAYNAAGGVTPVSTDWHIAGTGDFNGDGRSDILWRNDNGQFGDWLGQANGGLTYNSAAGVTSVSNDWHIAGTGDFNGDGRADILWRNDNGQVGDWLAQANGGFAYNAAAGVTPVSTDWHVEPQTYSAGAGMWDY